MVLVLSGRSGDSWRDARRLLGLLSATLEWGVFLVVENGCDGRDVQRGRSSQVVRAIDELHGVLDG